MRLFSTKFNDDIEHRTKLRINHFKMFIEDDDLFLEVEFSPLIIKKHVWSCAKGKTSEPNIFTFNLFKEFWDILQLEVTFALKHFDSTGRISRGDNASFISFFLKNQDPLSLSDYTLYV